MTETNGQAEQITQAILTYLEGHAGTIVSFGRLINEVEKVTGVNNPNRIKVIANSLIAAKVVDGKHGAFVKHRPKSEGFEATETEEAKAEDMGAFDYDAMMRAKTTSDAKYTASTGFASMAETAYKVEAEKLRKEVEAHKTAVSELGKKLQEAQKSQVELVTRMEEQLKAAQGQTRIVEVQLKRGEETEKVITGLFHQEFERVLTLAQARMNIFIYGPTGSGKSFLCSQIAESLNLRYAFVSCTAGMGEATLGGRLLPIGTKGSFSYIISEFVDCYENGGLFLLDEMDAADPNVLLLINSALANDRVAVTNRPEKPYAVRHEDFVCVAAANTVGTGADRMYSGRNKLDASTLDRFSVGKVYMDYDLKLEEKLCPDDILRNVLLSYRKKIETNRLERAMSTRFMRDAHKMKSQFGFSLEDINTAYFQGWREDEKSKVCLPKSFSDQYPVPTFDFKKK